MNKPSYTISCISAQEQQIMLLKSIFGIVGNRTQAEYEWIYLDAGTPDVLIIDYDDPIPAQVDEGAQLVSVGFSRHPERVASLPYHLVKPLKSRDVLTLLSALDSRMEQLRKSPKTAPSTPASSAGRQSADASAPESNEPLDVILSLVRNHTNEIYHIKFGDTDIYLDTRTKKVRLPEYFSYENATHDNRCLFRTLETLPDDTMKSASLADFFYEYTITKKNASLLAGLNKNFLFQIKQWPQFINSKNTKALIKASAYFSKKKASMQTASQELSLGIEQIIGFINAVHAQNLLIFEGNSALTTPTHEGNLEPTVQVVNEPSAPPVKSGLGGLFGRIRQRLGL